MNESLLAGLVLAVVLAAVLFTRIALLERRVSRLSTLDAKLDALLKHARIDFDPYKEVAPAVTDALRRGKKIEAIKHYRAASGADLREAKEFVEELQRRGGAST
jgi:ribosomal protein L7/L12